MCRNFKVQGACKLSYSPDKWIGSKGLAEVGGGEEPPQVFGLWSFYKPIEDDFTG